MSSKEFDLLIVGCGQSILDVLQPLLGKLKAKILTKGPELEDLLENVQLAPGTIVFVSTSLEGMTHLEIVQALSSCFQGLHLNFVTMDRALFEVKTLKKNGFTEIFLLPIDKKALEECMTGLQNKITGGGAKKFKAVKLVDIRAGQDLPFEVRVFLPLNNKYALLNGQGKLSEKKFETLKTRKVGSVFIEQDQIDKFYEFSAEQLIALGTAGNDAVSETERAERVQSTVRELFRSILDSGKHENGMDGGRDLLDQSKKIVENYVSKKTGVDLHSRIAEILGTESDFYSHAQSVSTIACLISMATGIGNPEDLAIAGLFHDIGLEGQLADVTIFDYEKLGEAEKKIYMLHPRASLNFLKEKKITLSPEIGDIIEKHHERADGNGFLRVPGRKIPREAQLLAYADAFECLSRPREGRGIAAPEEIHGAIIEKLGLEPELLGIIKKFLVVAS